MQTFLNKIVVIYLLLLGVSGTNLAFNFLRGSIHPGLDRYLSAALLFMVIAVWITVFYGNYLEPWAITVRRQTINLSKTDFKTPVIIALISDIHIGQHKKEKFLERVNEKIKKLKPDLVVIAGDFISDRQNDVRFLEPFRDLAGEIPTYAVLGNHDYLDEKDGVINLVNVSAVEPALKRFGINLLKNQSARLNVRGCEFQIIGLDDLWFGAPDINLAWRDITRDCPRIFIAHNPDAVLNLPENTADMTLSGHTHGGQIRLPFIGPLPELPTVLGQKYSSGLYFVKHIPVFITRGLGESEARVRLFTPPEIVLLTLR